MRFGERHVFKAGRFGEVRHTGVGHRLVIVAQVVGAVAHGTEYIGIHDMRPGKKHVGLEGRAIHQELVVQHLAHAGHRRLGGGVDRRGRH